MQTQILLRKTSFLDYPGRVSSVFFFPLCNLRCPWCHNRELVLGLEQNLVSFSLGLSQLHKRRSVIGGVVLTGGEPCLWDELPELITEIKKIKDDSSRPLLIKLDTNGMFPLMLETLFSREETRPDYISLDLKFSPSRYRELLPGRLEKRQVHETGPGGNNTANINIETTIGKKSASDSSFDPGAALIKSSTLLRDSGITHEYRTLALPTPFSVMEEKSSINAPNTAGEYGFVTEKDIEALSLLVMDDAPWYFRPFRGGNCLDPTWNDLEENEEKAAAGAEKLARAARRLGKNGIHVSRLS